jgi:hypothetical protein
MAQNFSDTLEVSEVVIENLDTWKALKDREAQETQDVIEAKQIVRRLEFTISIAKEKLAEAEDKLKSTKQSIESSEKFTPSVQFKPSTKFTQSVQITPSVMLQTQMVQSQIQQSTPYVCNHIDCGCGAKAEVIDMHGVGKCYDFRKVCEDRSWRRKSLEHDKIVCNRSGCNCCSNDNGHRKFGKYSVINSNTGMIVKYCHYGLLKGTTYNRTICNFPECPCGNRGIAVISDVVYNDQVTAACPFSEDAICHFDNGRI